ncbi:SET domain-containing protein SmydA-8-like isoform X1 [Nomia melanderi]|uniref:SET domain-containing protein SmydA-8-like isoform X1 n=1 Tax=Nomia melanderi TaxID=2448451 RepID=UPI0013044A32|nr:SET domain-containing protein SmydA-8-like isoform X1 [Nomia melanderi]XP_031847217.1 SET domain-containing protein SmydA-8-like isoform X1 [Nomia melanderi]XP_031847219.1 SET domain-containing protein SmydA-8-like isoform X1 [Nomia melanderi]
MVPGSEDGCPICGDRLNATLRCSGCRRQVYCSKEHQRQDWPNHRSVCQAWEIHESPELGRHLLASRDLSPGDLILSESPLVWGPALHTDQRVCIGCGEQCKSTTTICKFCLWPACDVNCPGLTDKNRHGLECPLLFNAKIVPRCEILLVIRMIILWLKKSKQWAALEKLQSHEESRGEGTIAYEEVMNVSQYVERLLPDVQGAKDIIGKICGLIDVNALETMPPEGSVAIYETACLLEHSCLANTRHSFKMDDKGRPRIIVKVLCSVKKGEHLSTMYTHALWSTLVRRAHLRDTKYFSCYCKRCTDPTELGTHLGTLICPQDNGYILSMDPLNFDSDWKCELCPGTLTASEVMEFTGKLEDDVDEAMSRATKETLVDLLNRLTTLLHPNHHLCISVSHSLIQLLPSNDPMKIDLCKRIIETTKILDPYNTRLSLYTAVTLRELSDCPGEDREELLSEAISLLQSEPPNSPGEKLRLLIEDEL